MRKYFWYMKSLRKRNLPSLGKNPPTLSPGLQVSTWALPAFFMPGDALWAAKMLPEVPNFARGPIEGEGYCCWRRTPQDFQLIFGGQVSIFSHLWTTPSSLLQSTVSNYLLATLLLAKSSWPWSRLPVEVELRQTGLTSARSCWRPGSWPLGEHPAPGSRLTRVQTSVPRLQWLTLWTQLWEIVAPDFCPLLAGRDWCLSSRLLGRYWREHGSRIPLDEQQFLTVSTPAGFKSLSLQDSQASRLFSESKDYRESLFWIFSSLPIGIYNKMSWKYKFCWSLLLQSWILG